MVNSQSVTDMLRNLSAQDFQTFGTGHLAYLRPVSGVEGNEGYGLYAADGQLLGLQGSLEHAKAAARHHGLEAITVH